MTEFINHLHWFQIIGIVSWTLFALQGLISLILGDFDFDVDFDGDVDFTGGDLFSPKGILYFLMGSSTYLSARFQFAELTTWSYVAALLSGVIFTIVLIFLYKWLCKIIKSSEPKSLSATELVGFKGKITRTDLRQRPYHYTVSVTGYFVEAISNDAYGFGEEVVLKDYNNNIYYI